MEHAVPQHTRACRVLPALSAGKAAEESQPARSHLCKGLAKEMKTLQIVRELSGFSLSSQLFHNDVKMPIEVGFPFLPSSLQSFSKTFSTEVKAQKPENLKISLQVMPLAAACTGRDTPSLWPSKREVP